MNTSSPQRFPAEPFDDYEDDGFHEVLPVRRRAQYLTPLTALLMALILGGVGFYVGIRVEKSQAASSGGTSAFAGGLAGAGSPTGSTSRSGSSSRTGFPGSGSLASRFAGAFGAAAGGTVGSVSSVDGNTLYVKESNGNTVKVKLSAATTISKSESVSRRKLYPGDQVVISGAATGNGTVRATSVTDSGASSTGSSNASSGSSNASSGSSSATSSGSSGSAGNASSAISSLFGGG